MPQRLFIPPEINRRNLTLGIELEMETPGDHHPDSEEDEDDDSEGRPGTSDLARRVRATYSDAMPYLDGLDVCVKYDGSLTGEGLEFAIGPIRSAHIMTAEKIVQFAAAMQRAGCWSYSREANCGMHVHMGTQLLTPEQWIAAAQLVDQHGAFFMALSHRREDQRHWAPCSHCAQSMRDAWERPNDYGRASRAFGFNGRTVRTPDGSRLSRQTIECRLPRGSLTRRGVLRAFELALLAPGFVLSSEYDASHSVSDTAPRLVRYAAQFPHLISSFSRCAHLSAYATAAAEALSTVSSVTPVSADMADAALESASA